MLKMFQTTAVWGFFKSHYLDCITSNEQTEITISVVLSISEKFNFFKLWRRKCSTTLKITIWALV